jgi:hypothetical protein
VRVRIGADTAGYLSRDDLLDLLRPRRKGPFDFQRRTLAGHSRPDAYRLRRFQCPVPGCQAGSVVALRVDPSDPLRCELHPAEPLREVT